MSEQRLLFEPRRPPWVDRLWQEIPTDTRRQLISILAEMGRNDPQRGRKEPPEEERDES